MFINAGKEDVRHDGKTDVGHHHIKQENPNNPDNQLSVDEYHIDEIERIKNDPNMEKINLSQIFKELTENPPDIPVIICKDKKEKEAKILKEFNIKIISTGKMAAFCKHCEKALPYPEHIEELEKHLNERHEKTFEIQSF
uniref:C2H2-type domain-containing protein n=1 Tax=Meloidogyne hapla TaxID=6305 RepID=A0A1I8B2P8_MELHA